VAGRAAAKRLALGLVDAERKRRRNVASAEVLEVDGLVLALGNVGDPSLDVIVVEREPADPTAALAQARRLLADRDLAFSIHLEPARHPALDEALRSERLDTIVAWPGMAAPLTALADVGAPAGVTIEPVHDVAGAMALAGVDAAAFDDDLAVSRAFFAPGSFGIPGARSFVAWEADEPVGIAVAFLHLGAVGLMGIGVVPRARRRGIGAALTVTAAFAFPQADLAWLHASEEGRSLYASLGFREVARWEVLADPL